MASIDLSDREVRQKFLQCNYSILAAYAWQNNKRVGKGIVVIESYAGDEGIRLHYEKDLKKLFSPKSIKDKIETKLKSYKPDKEVLVGFKIERNTPRGADSCILHSLGSTTFPVNDAVQIFDEIMEQFRGTAQPAAA
jgi:hypothetical protein